MNATTIHKNIIITEKSKATVKPNTSSLARTLGGNASSKIVVASKAAKNPVHGSKPKLKETSTEQTTKSNLNLKLKLAETTVKRSQPIKATYTPIKPLKVSEKNVMNLVHNVTVSSPPPQRKELPGASTDKLDRERTRTRTLKPDEVLILKDYQTERNDIAASKFDVESQEIAVAPVKDPIAFEITFNDKEKNISPSTKPEKPSSPDYEYEEDFESYESDFESVSSSSLSSNRSSLLVKSNSISQESETEIVTKENLLLTPKLSDERQYDSGHYDLKIPSNSQPSVEHIDDKDSASEGQIDSGIGYDTNYLTKSNAQPDSILEVSQELTLLEAKSKHRKINRRGYELLQKIQLDTMTYTIFDLKPLSYEYYMKIYGHTNTSQSSTQTNENCVNEDTQTNDVINHTVWTQWPPSISLKHIASEDYYGNRIGFGRVQDTEHANSNKCKGALQQSLSDLKNLKLAREQTALNIPLKSIDHDRLSLFLQKASITVAGIMTGNNKSIRTTQSWVAGFKEYFTLDFQNHTELLDSKVKKTYSNVEISDFLYIVHKTFSNAPTNYISIWNLSDPSRPVYLLSSWSSVTCILVPGILKDVVIAGLMDGSISCWHLGESSYWHANKNGKGTIYIPTQVVSLHSEINVKPTDFGRVVAIKSIGNEFESLGMPTSTCQIIALHEFGVLSLWTIFRSTTNDLSELTSNHCGIDHQSPWSNIKLIQIQSIDLRSVLTNETVRPKSGFEKTKSYFESDLFSDVALRELQAKDNISDKTVSDLLCLDLVLNREDFFVATNQNYILTGKQSLRKHTLRKIMLKDEGFSHSTALMIIPNEDIILIGHSNGSLEVLQAKEKALNFPNIKEEAGEFFENLSPMVDFATNAKSCAIENIIKDERKKLNQSESKELNENKRLSTQDTIQSTEVGGISNLVNNQILLHGLCFEQHGIKSIFVSKQSGCIYVLCGNKLRILDAHNCTEIVVSNDENLRDIAITKGSGKREFLVLLTDDSVQIHMVRKMKMQQ